VQLSQVAARVDAHFGRTIWDDGLGVRDISLAAARLVAAAPARGFFGYTVAGGIEERERPFPSSDEGA